MQDLFNIFCYGSNMSSARLRSRCPSVEFISAASLQGHQFVCNKISTDGSAKANLVVTRNSNDIVWGVLVRISPSDKQRLDIFEGLGKGYMEKIVEVETLNKKSFKACTYISEDSQFLDSNLLPYEWYKAHFMRGAIEYNLPSKYLSFLDQFKCCADQNLERHNKEMSIYDLR